jgi:HAD superfamily hydrolase (TIGR01549 family)
VSISAAELVSSRKHILLDFDGPICAAFAGYGAENISRQLATLIAMEGVDVPAELRGSSDPFELLHYAAATGDADLLIEVAAEFQRLEVLAAQIAPATPGAADVVEILVKRGHSVTVVSNNSLEAVQLYARRHRLSEVIAGIEARTEADPSLLKPNPHLLLNALNARGGSGSDSLMIGDSTFDVEAARHVGIPVIALANDPAKKDGLLRAQPDALISEITELIGT